MRKIEFAVFNPDMVRFGEICNDPMSGYALLAQAITLDPEIAWTLLYRQTEIGNWKDADENHLSRKIISSPWSVFSLCPKNS